MTLDVAALRADTPGCEQVIHLNNAGAALQPQPVLDTVVGYLEREGSIGGYETAAEYSGYLDGTYGALARLVGGRPDEIAVTPNATVAWGSAFYGMRFGENDRIITTSSEYASNYIAYLHMQNRTGVSITVAPDTPTGEIDITRLEALIDDDVKLISINHMPTQQGLVNPAADVGRVARAAGVPFLLDACQTVGQMPIDVEAIGCDFLSATSRKYLRGPRGMGFLYVRRQAMELLDPVTLDLHGATWTAVDRYEMRDDARRFETWEMNLAAKAGFHRAVEYALDVGVEAGWERIQRLASSLRAELMRIEAVTVTDRGSTMGGIVTFTVDGGTPEDVKRALAARGINVSTSTPAGSRIDMEQRGLGGVVRASLHYYNTEAELEALVGAVATDG